MGHYQILFCSISGIEAFLISAHRWTGNVIRMSENRLPKQAFYTVSLNMAHAPVVGIRAEEIQADMLKHNLKACSINPK